MKGILNSAMEYADETVCVDQVIWCLQLSVNQRGLLADKKREGRCPGDYFFFTVCAGKTFFWLYRSVGFEGNIMYAKKGITSAT